MIGGSGSDLSLHRRIDEIQKELLLKASIKDVCTLLDAKASKNHALTAKVLILWLKTLRTSIKQ